MSAAATQSWATANQRYLEAELARLRATLERYAGQQPSHQLDDDAGIAPLRAAMPAPPAIEQLGAAFGLSPFERDVLLLCAGVELDARVAALCLAAQGDARRPTFGLGLAALPGAHWSALTPTAPLRYWRLVELDEDDGLTSGRLRIDERILHYLVGVATVDRRLQGLVEPLPDAGALAASHRALAERVAHLWNANQHMPWPVVQLCGPAGSGRATIAAAACDSLGLRAWALRAADIPPAAEEQEALARLWDREAVLANAALLIACDDADARLLAFAERLNGPTVCAAHEPLRLARRPSVRLDVGLPTRAEQHALWQETLGALAAPLNGQLHALAEQFSLGAPGIRAARAALLERQASPAAEAGDIAAALWDACRSQARVRLDDLAQRITPAARWDDLVLPEAQTQTLHEIAAHVRQRALVYEAWGFATKGARGLGISALFAGASGTGKTMAAEVLANELRLDLYRIDLSAVVSKYIGETEKNLRRIFDAAEQGGAILLFDEADALFGKRSEVKDSHDRYANIEVSYLLQRMEAYRGLAILTTNLKQALDTAFLRRLRFVVQFAFPDAAQRARIWRRIFPAETPTEGLDAARLARLNVAGGNIRNIALGAAFLAADAGEPVRMVHLLRAARGEYQKLEKPLSDAEIKGWVEG